MNRTFCSFLAATVLISSLSFGQDKGSAGTMGISPTKPEKGPYVKIEGGYMVPYTYQIERTLVSFEMIPIPGGEIKIGSPTSEKGRSADEGPQYTVRVDPFWMAKTELTWGEYKTFMRMYDVFKRLTGEGVRLVDDSNKADAITVPTPLYEPSHTYEFGEDPKQPAVTMTQYAAKQYTKWLSGITQHQYRLPTEGEWEYAARAGSDKAYSFGDDVAELAKYAAYAENTTEGAAKVGSKLPNAFGLHDMHGNVWEWTIDQFDPKGFGDRGGKALSWTDATHWAKQADSRSVRGGGWQDPAERLRSAARMGSADEEWKSEDPNIPLSPWWFTSDPARMVGMRLVRSSQPLSSDLIKKFWEIDDESTQQDVGFRLQEGRGATGLPVPELIPEFQRKKQ